jgi:hypothetical protein
MDLGFMMECHFIQSLDGHIFCTPTVLTPPSSPLLFLSSFYSTLLYSTLLLSLQALSSSLWCVGTEGTLVLDCHSEKLLWLDALVPWVVGRDRYLRDGRSRSSTNTIQQHKPSPVSVRIDGLESQMSGSMSHTRVQKLTATIGNAAAIMGVISSSFEELGGASTQGMAGVAANAKKLQHATSGIMRVFAAKSSLQTAFAAGTRPKVSLLQAGYADSPIDPTKEGQGDRTGSPKEAPHSKPVWDKGPEDLPQPSKTHRDRASPPASSPIMSRDGSTEQGRERDRDRVGPAVRVEDEVTDSAGVIELLDSITGPLAHARALLEGSLALSLEQHAKSSASHRAGLKDVARSLMGVSVLDSIADEVTHTVFHCSTSRPLPPIVTLHFTQVFLLPPVYIPQVFAADEHRSEQCLEAVDSARSHLRHSAEAVVHSNVSNSHTSAPNHALT